MNVEMPGEVLDEVVPYTGLLKDNRRTRVRSSGRPPSQYFLKENILHLDEEREEENLEDDIKATGDSENNHQTDSAPRTRPASLGFRTNPSNEDIKMGSTVTTPPWLEELKKKKQIKLQRNSSESIIKNQNEDGNNAQHENDNKEKLSPSGKPVSEETSWGVHLMKKRHSMIEEDSLNKIGTNRVMTNTILVVNNSTKNNSSNVVSSPPTKNPPPIPSTAPPPSIFSTENFLTTQNDEYLDEFEDDAEIMEVMSPVNLDKKLSVREIETEVERVTLKPSEGDLVFDEVSSITLVKPLTRSESLNRHNLRTYGPRNLIYKPKSTENVSSDPYGLDQKTLKSETKLRFLRIIEQMEHVVNKNAIENQTIKNELENVIEENKLLSKSLDILKAEIARL